MPITFNVRQEIETAMKDAAKAIALKHGLAVDSDLDVGINGLNMKTGFTFSVMDKMGIPMSHERTMFEHLASRYGLQPGDFGKVFVMRGTKYRITGINPSAPSYPITGERVKDGKGFRFHSRDVVNLLGTVAKAA